MSETEHKIDSFPLGILHKGVRFHVANERDALRLLFIMVRDSVCTVEQAMDCLKEHKQNEASTPNADDPAPFRPTDEVIRRVCLGGMRTTEEGREIITYLRWLERNAHRARAVETAGRLIHADNCDCMTRGFACSCGAALRKQQATAEPTPRRDADRFNPAIDSPDDHPQLCEGCPPVGYPTDTTRCNGCPRAAGSNVK